MNTKPSRCEQDLISPDAATKVARKPKAAACIRHECQTGQIIRKTVLPLGVPLLIGACTFAGGGVPRRNRLFPVQSALLARWRQGNVACWWRRLRSSVGWVAAIRIWAHPPRCSHPQGLACCWASSRWARCSGGSSAPRESRRCRELWSCQSLTDSLALLAAARVASRQTLLPHGFSLQSSNHECSMNVTIKSSAHRASGNMTKHSSTWMLRWLPSVLAG